MDRNWRWSSFCLIARSGISHIQPPPHFCILSYLGMGGRGVSSCAVWPKLTPWRLDGRQKMSNLEWLLTFGDNQMRSPLRDENPFLADAPILNDIIRTICIDLYRLVWLSLKWEPVPVIICILTLDISVSTFIPHHLSLQPSPCALGRMARLGPQSSNGNHLVVVLVVDMSCNFMYKLDSL